jgi:hypothetical protein
VDEFKPLPIGEWHQVTPLEDHRSNKDINDGKDTAQGLSQDDIARLKARAYTPSLFQLNLSPFRHKMHPKHPMTPRSTS